MRENIWRIDVDALDEDRIVRPLFEAVEAAPGFTPVEYDLNKKEQWRSFVLDRAVVDALTQRTQLVRIAGEGETRTMVAMGKHGEEPTVVLQIADAATPEAIVGHWEQLMERVDVASLRLDSKAWRDALGAIELDWPDGPVDPVQLAGWPRGDVPPEVESMETIAGGSEAIRLDRREAGVYLWLGAKGRLEGKSHRRGLEAVAEQLRG